MIADADKIRCAYFQLVLKKLYGELYGLENCFTELDCILLDRLYNILFYVDGTFTGCEDEVIDALDCLVEKLAKQVQEPTLCEQSVTTTCSIDIDDTTEVTVCLGITILEDY